MICGLHRNCSGAARRNLVWAGEGGPCGEIRFEGDLEGLLYFRSAQIRRTLQRSRGGMNRNLWGGKPNACLGTVNKNNLAGAKFIDQNNTWMSEREVEEQATGH